VSANSIDCQLMVGRRTLVAEEGGEVVGFAELEDDGHLDMLYLRGDTAGRGVGRRLYSESSRRPGVWASDGSSPKREHHGSPVLRAAGLPGGWRAKGFAEGRGDDSLRHGEAPIAARRRRLYRPPPLFTNVLEGGLFGS
jgi:hypothetical protein